MSVKWGAKTPKHVQPDTEEEEYLDMIPARFLPLIKAEKFEAFHDAEWRGDWK